MAIEYQLSFPVNQSDIVIIYHKLWVTQYAAIHYSCVIICQMHSYVWRMIYFPCIINSLVIDIYLPRIIVW